jgi:hypothetical protein
MDEKNYILKLDVYNKGSADEYCNSAWKLFCRITTLTSNKFMLPWIHPSVDFSSESQSK